MTEQEFVNRVYIWDMVRMLGLVREDEVWHLSREEEEVYEKIACGCVHQAAIGSVDGWLRTFLIDNDWKPGDRWRGAKATKFKFHTKEKRERHEKFLERFL